VADADGHQLHRALLLDPVDHPAQVLLQIAGVVDRQVLSSTGAPSEITIRMRRSSGGRACGVRPEQRLAVDVFLEQALAHHQAQVLARAAPGFVGLL
jgi:hypothetical protein